MELEAEAENMVHLSQGSTGNGRILSSMPTAMKKSQHFVMSSSLRERLKKCGRYHPATPPSNRQTTPLLSQERTPVSGLHHTSTSSQQSPISDQTRKHVQPLMNTSGVRKTLPRPRNIWAGKSNSEKVCVLNAALDTSYDSMEEKCEGSGVPDGDSSDGAKVTNVCATATNSTKIKDSDIHAVQRIKSNQTSMSPERELPQRDTNEGVNMSYQCKALSENDGSHGTHLTARHFSEHANQISPSRDVDTTNMRKSSTACRNMSRTDSLKVREDLTTDGIKQHNRSKSTCEELIILKKQLKTQLTAGKEVLRKLNMVKTYRTKNDLHHLQNLTEKWRSICQNAVLDLHQMTPVPRPSLNHLMRQLGIDAKLVHYNPVEESFVAP